MLPDMPIIPASPEIEFIPCRVPPAVTTGIVEVGSQKFTAADIGSDCYIVDDQTVAKTNGTNTRSVAGKIMDVDAQGVWVRSGL